MPTSMMSLGADLAPSPGSASKLLRTVQQPDSIWPEGQLPDPKACAETSREFAKAIIEYWKDCRAAAELDPRLPLDIVDIAPGEGKSCWMMMKSLQRMAPQDFNWRYLPLAPKRNCFSDLLHSTELSAEWRGGRLVPLLWDPAKGHPLLLRSEGRLEWIPRNPVVIIAHDRFAYFEQRFLAVHYGKIMEAEFCCNGSDPTISNVDLNEGQGDSGTKSNQDIRWETIDCSLEIEVHGVDFKNYIKKYNSSPLPFPIGAMRWFEQFQSICDRGFFLISLGRGIATEQDLRLLSFSVLLDEFKTRDSLPINFLIIEEFLKIRGIASSHWTLPDGQIMQLCVHGHQTLALSRLQRLTMAVSASLPGHLQSIVEASAALGSSAALQVRLALLRLSEFDPAVFLAAHMPLTAALADAGRAGTLDRSAWKYALERVWSNHLPTRNGPRLHQTLAPAAMHCGAWALARDVLLRGMKIFGESASDLANLAWCANRTGQTELAQEIVTKALGIDRENALANEVRRRVDERVSGYDGRWRRVLRDPLISLILEPLDVTHSDSLFFQYRDPQISVMTGLPPLKSREEARQWILEQDGDDCKVNYAIMLPDEGFAGFINLAVSGHAAFFCFWTCVDFQGRGLAGKAGKIACKYALSLGVNVMLTSAFKDNQRSISALQRMGFIELPIRALPPDHDRIFFIIPPTEEYPLSEGVRELTDYYAREKIALHFPAQEGSCFDEPPVSDRRNLT